MADQWQAVIELTEKCKTLTAEVDSLKAKAESWDRLMIHVPSGWKPAQCYQREGELLLLGQLPEEMPDEAHSCYEMGCGLLWGHVIFRGNQDRIAMMQVAEKNGEQSGELAPYDITEPVGDATICNQTGIESA